ncbi:MAG TPA: DMT family transporter [Anaerolineales bacterium]|nr:DMT family transporter [Anaerolineales bacterium]
MKFKHWFAFILLAAIWSSSFLWIKIAIRELSPITLVALRTFFGALVGIIAILVTRTRLPHSRSVWIALMILGLTNVAIPFGLITWGELSIDSAVASILNATVPLFTFLIATIFLNDEGFKPGNIVGLLIGFGGVIILLMKDLQPGSHNLFLGQAAVLLAAIFYAGSMVYARITTDRVSGLVRGIMPLMSATVIMGTGSFALESPVKLPSLPITWLAVVWLGVLGSGLAFILWYYLLQEIGPTRAALVTYILPLGGVILGVVFLNEALSWNLAFGGLMIVTSVIVMNRKSSSH